MKKTLVTLIAAGLCWVALGASSAGTATAGDQDVIAQQLPSYPLTTCLVSGEPLDEMGTPIDFVTEGRLVRLCCKGCVKMVRKKPAELLAKLDKAVIAAQKASYPLKTCVVSGEDMGEALEHVHGTRLVRFCCKGCVKAFKKDSDKFMAKVDAALIEAQRADYPSETCIVSNEGLSDMGAPIDFLYGTRLVRFCCKGCVKAFKKDPSSFLASLDKLAKQKS